MGAGARPQDKHLLYTHGTGHRPLIYLRADVSRQCYPILGMQKLRLLEIRQYVREQIASKGQTAASHGHICSMSSDGFMPCCLVLLPRGQDSPGNTE